MVKTTFQIVREKTDSYYKRCWGNCILIKGENNKVRPLPDATEKIYLVGLKI